MKQWITLSRNQVRASLCSDWELQKFLLHIWLKILNDYTRILSLRIIFKHYTGCVSIQIKVFETDLLYQRLFHLVISW